MPSPDIRGFVDLTLYDLESQSVYLSALDYMRVAMPEFRPVEGSIETVLMQAVAVEVAELVRSVNRLPGGVLQALLKLFEVERQDGVSPSAIVKMVAVSASQAEVPAGTRFFYQPTLDTTPLVLETTTSVTMTQTKNVSSVVYDEMVDPMLLQVITATPHGFSAGDQIAFLGNDGNTIGDILGPWTIASVQSIYAFTITDFSATQPTDWSIVVAHPDASKPATGFATASGTTITNEFNGISAGSELDILSSVPQIASAFLATAVTGGKTTETDSEYFARATANLARANLSLVTADNYTQWVLNGSGFSDVYRAKTLDTTNAYRETVGGNVLLVVAPIDASTDNLISGIGSGAVTPETTGWGEKDEIRTAAKEISHPNLEVNVTDPVIVSVKVDVTVSPASGKTGVEASNSVLLSLTEFLSPNTWDWSTTVRKNDLIARAYNSEDSQGERTVGYVQSVSISVDGIHVPEVNYYTAQAALTNYTVLPGDIGECEAGEEHGLDPVNTNYVALHVPNGWMGLYSGWRAFKVVEIVDDFVFRVDLKGSDVTDGFYEWYHIGYTTPTATSNGDLVIIDPAPLVMSGDHEITVA